MSPRPTIRLAQTADLPFLTEHDRHVRTQTLQTRVAESQILIAGQPAETLGWLRWGLFWDEIPFMNMLFVLEHSRGRGVGGALVSAWEELAREDGHRAVLTSTRSDESAQHFYRRRGYEDSGVLLQPGEPAELILRKELAPR